MTNTFLSSQIMNLLLKIMKSTIVSTILSQKLRFLLMITIFTFVLAHKNESFIHDNDTYCRVIPHNESFSYKNEIYFCFFWGILFHQRWISSPIKIPTDYTLFAFACEAIKPNISCKSRVSDVFVLKVLTKV